MADWQMIPPPYPFPNEWAALAQRQQRVDASGQQWLSPFMPVSLFAGMPKTVAETPTTAWPPAVPLHAPMADATNHTSRHVDTNNVQYNTSVECIPEEEVQEEEDDGEYEYGYVLRNEWRQYLRETVLSDGDDDHQDEVALSSSTQRHRRRPQEKHQNQKKTKNTNTQRRGTEFRSMPAVRLTSPLELALDDARAIEKQRRRERQLSQRDGAWRRIEHIETALHTQFEAFCDCHTPTVWPQGAS